MIWLIFAHFIGDFALQTSWVAENKGRYWYVMLVHCMVWAAIVCGALEYQGLMAIWKPIFLVLGHAAMDIWKSKTAQQWWKTYPDQAWHLVQCAIVYYL